MKMVNLINVVCFYEINQANFLIHVFIKMHLNVDANGLLVYKEYEKSITLF